MLFWILIKGIQLSICLFKTLLLIKMSAKNRSSFANANANAAANASAFKKPFCKVCQDAGKPENVYTSHFVRSAPGPNGKVVCPTLLSQECRYCSGRGHTVKFCTVLEKNKKAESLLLKKEIVLKKEPVSKQSKPLNAFALLDVSDDEEEEDVSNINVDEFPVLGFATTGVKNEVVKNEVVKNDVYSYAAALATIVDKPVADVVVAPHAIVSKLIKKTWTSWADCPSDSDSDEDEVRVSSVRVVPLAVVEDNSAW